MPPWAIGLLVVGIVCIVGLCVCAGLRDLHQHEPRAHRWEFWKRK